MFSCCMNFFYQQARTLITAIDEKNNTKFINAVKAMPDVNQPFSGSITPLDYCLLHVNYEFAFKLLDEFKANPNVKSKRINHTSPIPLLRSMLEGNDISAAKLLILYGATLDEDTFLPHPNPKAVARVLNKVETKPTLLAFKNNYYDKICEEKSNPTELARLWQEISNEETEPSLKACYEAKARTYLKFAPNPATSPNSSKSSPEASIKQPIHAKTPLLTQVEERNSTRNIF